jgi:ubiquitin-protein ligase
MSTVRLRRLQADHVKLVEYVRQQPRVQVLQTEGDPPELYQIRYQVVGLRQKDEGLRTVKEHLVEIALPLNYPRLPPQCRMLTPVFHPNIAPHAICIGDHWSSGESLTSIVARIGELLSYQSYNTKSPLNGEAARWVDENMDQLPLDGVSFVPNDSPVVAAPPRAAARTGSEGKVAQDVPDVLPLDDDLDVPIKDDLDDPIPFEPVGRTAPPLADDIPVKLPVAKPEVPRPRPPAPPKPADALPPKLAAELIRLRCASCGVTLRFRSELLGRTVRCPACKNAFKLPEKGLE